MTDGLHPLTGQFPAHREDAAAGTGLGLSEVLAAVRELGEEWVGFDDSHHYGDRLLTLLADAPTVVAARVAEAKAAAWDEGYDAASRTTVTTLTPNPYRAARLAPDASPGGEG